MKKFALTLFIALSFIGCDSTKKTPQIKDEVIVTGGSNEAEPEKVSITLTGKVSEINKGKDGYTASIISDDNETYFATISIPNLADPKQYRTVEIGEIITFSGEAWNMEQDKYVVVRELQPKK